MTVMFCGHADFQAGDEIKKKMFSVLREILEMDKNVVFYFGGYGAFDSFSFCYVEGYKQIFERIKTVFITPYITPTYENLMNAKMLYDECIYPELENVPLKFAIIERNKWMVEKSDIVVAYVNRGWGGAWKTLEYAKKQGKRIFNLAEL